MTISHKNLFRQPFFWTSVCSLLALGILIGLYSYAWVAPTGNPNSSAGAAINFSGGNVGIGTAAPGLDLDINGPVGLPVTSGTSQIGIFRLSQTGGVVLDMGINGVSPYGGWIQSTNGGSLGSTYPLLLNPNGGNVGIGTTSPNTVLDVFKTSGTLANVKLNVANNAIGISSPYTAGANYAPGITWHNSDLVSNTKNAAGIFAQLSAAGSYLHFGTSNSYVSGITNDAMVIDYNGKVGIGTASPGQKLSVAGVIESTTGGIKFPDATIQTTAAITYSSACAFCTTGCGYGNPMETGRIETPNATLGMAYGPNCSGTLQTWPSDTVYFLCCK